MSGHACLGYTLKDSPHCHWGIWGEEMRTLLCLCIGASACVSVYLCACVRKTESGCDQLGQMVCGAAKSGV